MKPLPKRSLVEVELPSATGVQGKAKVAVPQAVPVFEIVPIAEKVAQPAVALPALETTRSVVEALSKRLVKVAEEEMRLVEEAVVA